MNRSHPLLLLAAASAIISLGAGCSISTSVESSSSLSESSSSSSTSSSPTGGISKEKVPYRDDVANLTYSVAGSSMTAVEFPDALARTAQEFKISDWSQEKATYYGIGAGLKKAGVSKDNISRQSFLANVLKSNKDALRLIQEGYKH